MNGPNLINEQLHVARRRSVPILRHAPGKHPIGTVDAVRVVVGQSFFEYANQEFFPIRYNQLWDNKPYGHALINKGVRETLSSFRHAQAEHSTQATCVKRNNYPKPIAPA